MTVVCRGVLCLHHCTCRFGVDDFVLRIGWQAELGHIEAFELDLLRDTYRRNRVDQREDYVGEAEYNDCHESGSANLREELRVVSVEQARHTLAGLAQV